MSLSGWSPFVPGDADASSLPLAMLEYTFSNNSTEALETVFTFAAAHSMRQQGKSGCCGQTPCAEDHSVLGLENGFRLHQPQGNGPAHRQGDFAVVAGEKASVNCQWFRGGWFDHQSVLWRQMANGETPENPPVKEGGPSAGGSLAIPFRLEAGESRTIRLTLAWYVPYSNVHVGGERPDEMQAPDAFHRPWYAGRFSGIEELLAYANDYGERLRERTRRFAARLAASGLPAEAQEAVSANLTILKSPTVLRQRDGRVWAWEGCCDDDGCCHGSCTHVWMHNHVNPQRPTYALNEEAGLLLCTWPKGGRLTLPFPYSEEVWTGFEYQVASHLIMMGEEEKGREIVRAARSRYDGRVRNPFDEFECGHWYARALSSYALLQAYKIAPCFHDAL